MTNNTAIYIYVALSIIAIGILIGSLVNCENKKCSNYTSEGEWTGKRLRDYFYHKNNKIRNMCLCSSGCTPLCANRQELLKTYDEGNTEYQDFAGKQKHSGGAFWHNTNFMHCC